MINKKLLCPVCHTALSLDANGKTLICEKSERPHTFDIAASGYVNLALGHSGGGDSKECVRSRSDFLSLGHYKPISEKMNELADKYLSDGETLLDAGCGEGYYTVSLAKTAKKKNALTVGIDISKPAVEHTAKSAKREGLSELIPLVSSIYELPLSDRSVSVVTSIFAPCPENEFSRVLKDGGHLIIAAAGENHLMGLKKALYETVYTNEDRADLPSEEKFELVEKDTLSYKIELGSNKEILDLFAMTPYYYRTSLSDKEKLPGLDTLVTEVQIDFSVYRKNS